MAGKENSGIGCLIVIGIAILWIIIRAIVNWSEKNPGMLPKIAIGFGIVVTCLVIIKVAKKSWSMRRAFDRDYGAWLSRIEDDLESAEKFIAEDEMRTADLDKRITGLETKIRGFH